MPNVSHKAVYTEDIILLDSLSAEDKSDFLKFMDELDAENAAFDFPYGLSMWGGTGCSCWYESYKDGYTAKEALAEDMSYGE